MKHISRFFLIPFMISGCAVNYNHIQLQNFTYNEKIDTASSVTILHSQQNIFQISKNRAYEKRQSRKKLWIVPIQVINNGNYEFTITDSTTKVINNYEIADLVPPDVYTKKISRKAGLPYYMAGGLFGSVLITANGLVFLPSPALILPVIGAVNFFKFRGENKQLLIDINQHDLYGKNIPCQSEKFGFICIKADTINNLFFRLNYEY